MTLGSRARRIVLRYVMPGFLSCVLAMTAFASERVLESDERHVVFEIVPPPAELERVATSEREYVRFHLPGMGMSDEPGKPEVPMGGVRIALPPGTVPRLRVLQEDWSERRVGAVMPVPKRVGVREPFGPDYVMEEEPREEAPYLASPTYPAAAYRLSEAKGLRDLRVVEVGYAAARAEVFARAHRLLRRAVLEIVFEPDPTRDATRSTRPALRPELWDRTLRSGVLNPEAARAWARGGPGDGTSVGDAPWGGGDQWKVQIDQTAFYELSFASLAAAGFPPGVPVGQVAVYQRRFDLADVDDALVSAANLFVKIEVPALLRDRNGNGAFDAGDGILFWARSFRDQWMTSGWEHEDLFDKRNFVWVRIDPAGGARMTTRPGAVPTAADSLASTPSTVFREEDRRYTQYPPDMGPGRGSFESEFYYWNSHTDPTGTDGWEFLPADTFQAPDLVPGAAGILRARVCPTGQSQVTGNQNHTNVLTFSVNGTQIGQRRFYNADFYVGPSVPEVVSRDSVMTTVPIPGGLLVQGANTFLFHGDTYAGVQIIVRAQQARFLFDWYEVTYPRQLVARTDQLLLTTASGAATPQRVRVRDFGGTDLLLLDLTNAGQPVQVVLDPAQIVSVGGGRFDLRFEHDNGAGVGTYLASREASATAVTSSAVTRVPQPSLLAAGIGAKYVVVAHDELLAGAQELAAYRAARYSSRAVAVSEVWDVFHNGTRDPVALKSYAAYAFHRWADPIVFLTLVGDASEDHRTVDARADRDLLPSHSLWTDYEGVPEETDQYYAEVTHDGLGAFDDLSDLYVGRLAVNTPDELTWNVDRIRRYETERPDEAWRRKVLLFSDDALSGDLGGDIGGYGWKGIQETPFCTQSRTYADSLLAHPVDKIVPDVFCLSQFTHPCADSCNAPDGPLGGQQYPIDCEALYGADCGIWYDCRVDPQHWQQEYPCVREAVKNIALPVLRDKLNDGVMIWNYEGHANKYFLAHEIVWRDDTFDRHDVQTLTNVDRPFIFLGFACHLGEIDRGDELLNEDCMSEKMMNVRTVEHDHPAGCIGAFASSGFEFLTPNLLLNEYVMEAFFRPERAVAGGALPDDGSPAYVWTLGESTTRARLMYQAYYPGDFTFRQAAQRFVLLGDPALSPDLGSPALTASVNGVPVEDVRDPFFASAQAFPGPITVQVTASDGRGLVATRIVDTAQGEVPLADYTTTVERATTDGVAQVISLAWTFSLRPNETYDVRFEAVDGNGKTAAFVIRSDRTFKFLDRPAAFPNPFNDRTTVAFKTTGGSSIRSAELGIYTVAGRKVREVRRQGLGANSQHQIEWDGRDDRGISVSNGTYLLRVLVTADDGSLSETLPVVRMR